MTTHTCGQPACCNKAHEPSAAELIRTLDEAVTAYGIACVQFGGAPVGCFHDARKASAEAFDTYIKARQAVADRLGVR